MSFVLLIALVHNEINCYSLGESVNYYCQVRVEYISKLGIKKE